MMGVNLIPASIRESRAVARRVRIWCAALGVAGGGVALAAGVLATRSTAQTQPSHDTDVLARLASREEQRERAQQEATRLERAIVERRLAPQPDWSLMLRTLASSRHGQIALDAVEIGVTGEVASVAISGSGASPRAVDEFVSALEGLEVFATVQQLENRARVIGGETLSAFRVRCTIEATPAPAGVGGA